MPPQAASDVASLKRRKPLDEASLPDFAFADAQRLARLRAHWWGRVFLVPRWREKMVRHQEPLWRRSIRLIALPYVALTLIFLYVQWQARDLIRGAGTPVALSYAGDADVQAGHPLLLGTTAAWVFVYWPEQHRAEVIAQQSLRSLAYPAVPPSRRTP